MTLPTHLIARCVLPALALLSGCAAQHAPEPPAPAPIVRGTTPLAPAPVLGPSALETCLLGGGALTVRDTVDNDDVTEHGEVVSFAASADGRLAVGTVDGTVKLWTLSGLVGAFTSAFLTYGPELDGGVPEDLAFLGDRVVAGDRQGLVTAWTDEGDYELLGGTEPGLDVRAVALDRDAALLALADERAGGGVQIRSLTEPLVVGPLTTELAVVDDLAFAAGRTLLVAGGDARGARLEARAAPDYAAPTALFRDESAVEARELAVSKDGGTIAVATDRAIVLLDAALRERGRAAPAAHEPVSVALSRDARVVFSAGAEGTVRALSAADGRELAAAPIADPVSVRTAGAADVAVVATRPGLVHVLGCRTP